MKKKRKLRRWVKIVIPSSSLCMLGFAGLDVYGSYHPYRHVTTVTAKTKDDATITYDVHTKQFFSNGYSIKADTLSTNKGIVCTDLDGQVVAQTNDAGTMQYINTDNDSSENDAVNGWLNDVYYVDGLPLGTDEDSLLFVTGETGFYYLQADQGGKRLINGSVILNDGREVRYDEQGHIVTQEINNNDAYYFGISEANEVAESTYTVLASEYIRTSAGNEASLNIVNHRGYHEENTENTLSAFEASKAKDYSYIEADVQMTADDIPVLIHDQSLYRLAGEAVNINDVSLTEVKQYSLEGEEITEFEELISYCKANELSPYIELKSETITNQEQVQIIYDIVNKYSMVGNVTWISFNETLLDYIAGLDNIDRIGYLVSSYSKDVLYKCRDLQDNGVDCFIDASYSCYDKYLSSCKKAEIPLEVWTLNSETDIAKLDSYVTGVTTDICLPE